MKVKFLITAFVRLTVILSIRFTGLAQADSSSANTTISTGSQLSSLLSLLPNGYGGWKSTNGGPWTALNVTSYSGASNDSFQYVPTEGGANHGVEGAETGDGEGVITNTHMTVNFSEISGKTDSIWGPNAWSLQVNTNYFLSDKWVQVVYQNNLDGKSYFGIWEWNDIYSLTGYKVYMVNADLYTLSTSMLLYESLYWYNATTLEGAAELGTPNNYTAFALNGPDLYGLFDGHWASGSGTILGAGGGSEANFASATETTNIVVSAPSPWDQIPASIIVTGESNNLTQEGYQASYENETGVGGIGYYEIDMNILSET